MAQRSLRLHLIVTAIVLILAQQEASPESTPDSVRLPQNAPSTDPAVFAASQYSKPAGADGSKGIDAPLDTVDGFRRSLEGEGGQQKVNTGEGGFSDRRGGETREEAVNRGNKGEEKNGSMSNVSETDGSKASGEKEIASSDGEVNKKVHDGGQIDGEHVGANSGGSSSSENGNGKIGNNNGESNKENKVSEGSSESGEGKSGPGSSRRLPEGALAKLRAGLIATCKFLNCTEQSEEAKKTRAEFREVRVKQLTKRYNGDSARAESEVDEIFAETQQAKVAVFAAAGLTSDWVVPADTGVWQREIPLTLEQADRLIQEAKSPSLIATAPPTSNVNASRAKRQGMLFRQFPNYKWPIPVPYTFASDITPENAVIVRGALQEIAAQTCIQFQELAISYEPHMEFQNIQTGVCGQSVVGNQGWSPHPVSLNFNCGSNMNGVTIHETLHALGIHHHQIRPDRDEWITVQWQNVDTRHYDWFARADGIQYYPEYSTYGVPYDYNSVMHYDGYAGSWNRQPTMIPIKEPTDFNLKALGDMGHGLSNSDVALLRKMYCNSPDCNDEHPWCGHSANQGVCNREDQLEYMSQTCRLSCNFCS